MRYLPGFSLSSYLQFMLKKFPEFYKTFWFDRPDTLSILKEMVKTTTDFEGGKKGGRGDLYRKAQQNPLVRIVGIKYLLELATDTQNLKDLPSTYKILDVLGGDGTVTRALNSFYDTKRFTQLILTSDIAGDMVAHALKNGLAAIREPAQHLFLKNNSFEAVIIAYGTHHILKSELITACKEAFRVLKSGGRIVIHDFEENSPIARWFKEVVDKYSITGHKFSHFTPEELKYYLQKSGFKKIKVLHMYDPFIVSYTNKQQAYKKLMDYVLNMYGLSKLRDKRNIEATREKVYYLIKKYIHYNDTSKDNFLQNYKKIKKAKLYWRKSLSFFEKSDKFIAELPRVALVGVGIK